MLLVRRAVLVSELKLAHDEAARLGEMIVLFENSHMMDEPRLHQLRLERIVANKRAMRLHEALRKLDASGEQSRTTSAA